MGWGWPGWAWPTCCDCKTPPPTTPGVRAGSFGKAKNVILVHLYGSPSQIETFDPKPDAPLEVRGDLNSIPSNLPGCDVCELLPKTAQVMDRCTVIRSMHHPFPLHGVAYALTGVPAIGVPMELNPRDPAPLAVLRLGGRLSRLREKRRPAPPLRRAVEHGVAVQVQQPPGGRSAACRSVRRVPGRRIRPGLDRFHRHRPRGASRRRCAKMVFEENDPYMGVTTDGHFVVPSASNLQGDITLDRLFRRRTLVEQLEQAACRPVRHGQRPAVRPLSAA